VVLAPQDGAAYLAATPGVTVIDVRTPAEFATGHLEHAVNMDIEGGGFSADIKDLPKDGEYAVYCHSGRRSAIAVATMVAAGFTRVHDLGGIVDWQAAGLPVVTG
jgi:rhodanese-related sulfurtransferase